MASVNDEIAQGLIPYDIDLRRVTGDVQNKVTRRLKVLANDMAAELFNSGIFDAKRNDTKRRRLQLYKQKVRPIINQAYSEINALVKSDLKDVALLESMKQVDNIQEHVP